MGRTAQRAICRVPPAYAAAAVAAAALGVVFMVRRQSASEERASAEATAITTHKGAAEVRP